MKNEVKFHELTKEESDKSLKVIRTFFNDDTKREDAIKLYDEFKYSRAIFDSNPCKDCTFLILF